MGNNISNAAGCGTWYIYKTSTPSCYTERCGIWNKTALVQKQYYKRNVFLKIILQNGNFVQKDCILIVDAEKYSEKMLKTVINLSFLSIIL